MVPLKLRIQSYSVDQNAKFLDSISAFSKNPDFT